MRRLASWSLLIVEFVVFALLWLSPAIAGVSAGFAWSPFVVHLAVGAVLAVLIVPISWTLGKVERTILIVLALLPAAFFGYVVSSATWAMSHAVEETWIIPAGYEGPLHVVQDVPNGAIATVGKLQRVYKFDTNGICIVRESGSAWTKLKYVYLQPDGTKQSIPKAAAGSIDDTAENRADPRVRIYFTGAGEFSETDTGCTYKTQEAFVESPQFALSRASTIDTTDWTKAMGRLYPGMCSATTAK